MSVTMIETEHGWLPLAPDYRRDKAPWTDICANSAGHVYRITWTPDFTYTITRNGGIAHRGIATMTEALKLIAATNAAQWRSRSHCPHFVVSS